MTVMPAWLGTPLLLVWRLLDLLIPKRSDHWAFFDHPLKRGQFIENARAVYEQVKDDPRVRCQVFVRTDQWPTGVEESERVRVVRLDSVAGLWALARCRVLLLTNSTSLDMSLAWRNSRYGAPRPWLHRRITINLWHGIPLKRLFALANPEQRQHGDRDRHRRRERRFYTGLVASSETDAYAMAAIFHPLPPRNVWVTGLPRNDFLRIAEDALPVGLRDEVASVRALCTGRRLVLYAPTYRDASVSMERSYCFSDGEVAQLKNLLRRHDAVLGIRGHYLVNGPAPLDPVRHLDGDVLLDLGHEHFQEIAPLLRESALVITDYSSVYIDALYLDLPVLCFAYDLEHYRTRQNGLLYDLELAFPGPVTNTFDALLTALDAVLAQPKHLPDERYLVARRLFFQYLDTNNSQRVVQRIHAAIAGNNAA